MHPCRRIRRFDHVGITVADLDTVTAFFVGLGFEVEGRMFMEGEFVDTVIGIPNSRSEIVMLRPPDGGTGLELSSFIRPEHEPGSPDAMSNELGLRNVISRWTTSRRSSTGWLRTATTWSAASVSTRTSGAWRTCADRRGSSWPWPSESTDQRQGENVKGDDLFGDIAQPVLALDRRERPAAQDDLDRSMSVSPVAGLDAPGLMPCIVRCGVSFIG